MTQPRTDDIIIWRGSEWQVRLNMFDMVDILLKLALFSESKDYKMQRLRMVHWLQGYVQKNFKIRCILKYSRYTLSYVYFM